MQDTSLAAKAAIKPHAPIQRERILSAIRGAGPYGATRNQLVLGLKMPNNTVCPRVLELIGRGLIYESKQMRPTMAGRKAHVLLATRGLNG